MLEGPLCKLVHDDAEILLSREEVVRYVIVKMLENMDKLHRNRKLAFSDHTDKVNMCLVLLQIILRDVAVNDNTATFAIIPPPWGHFYFVEGITYLTCQSAQHELPEEI